MVNTIQLVTTQLNLLLGCHNVIISVTIIFKVMLWVMARPIRFIAPEKKSVFLCMVAKEDSVEQKLWMSGNVMKSQSNIPLLFLTVSIVIIFALIRVFLIIISVIFAEKKRTDYSSMFPSVQCLQYALWCYECCKNKWLIPFSRVSLLVPMCIIAAMIVV